MGAGVQLVFQAGKQRGFVLQHRDRGKRHRDRAQAAGLDLRLQEVGGGARHVRAGAGLLPRRGLQAFAPHDAQQLMPARMEFDPVDAVPGAIVRDQLGRVAVGHIAQRQDVLAAEFRAELAQVFGMPAGAFALHAFAQGTVAAENIVIFEHGNLVDDFMGGPSHGKLLRIRWS